MKNLRKYINGSTTHQGWERVGEQGVCLHQKVKFPLKWIQKSFFEKPKENKDYECLPKKQKLNK